VAQEGLDIGPHAAGVIEQTLRRIEHFVGASAPRGS